MPLEPDIVIECTGVGEVVVDATHLAAPGAGVALTGISHSERAGEAYLDALNKDLVLGQQGREGQPGQRWLSERRRRRARTAGR